MSQPVATPSKHLRMIDAELQKIEGIQVVANATFRTGVLMLSTGTSTRPGQIVCHPETLAWLDKTEQRGGRDWGVLANLLRTEIKAAGDEMAQSKMVDLTAKGHKVVDRRRVTRPSNDRVDHVVRGISDITAQMSAMLAGQVAAAPATVAATAKRYSVLAAEMKQLRELLTAAEGMFEVAQMQVVALMDRAEEG